MVTCNSLLATHDDFINEIIQQYFTTPGMLGIDNKYHSINNENLAGLIFLLMKYFGENEKYLIHKHYNLNDCKKLILIHLEKNRVKRHQSLSQLSSNSQIQFQPGPVIANTANDNFEIVYSSSKNKINSPS